MADDSCLGSTAVEGASNGLGSGTGVLEPVYASPAKSYPPATMAGWENTGWARCW